MGKKFWRQKADDFLLTKQYTAQIQRKRNQSTFIWGSCYCFCNGCQNYFKVSCALNRPFEHTIRSITFKPRYYYYSSRANRCFNDYLHIVKRDTFEDWVFNHPPCKKLFLNTCSSDTFSNRKIRMRIGCRTANTIDPFSPWTGISALPVNNILGMVSCTHCTAQTLPNRSELCRKFMLCRPS